VLIHGIIPARALALRPRVIVAVDVSGGIWIARMATGA
jgi:hypothetical protein